MVSLPLSSNPFSKIWNSAIKKLCYGHGMKPSTNRISDKQKTYNVKNCEKKYPFEKETGWMAPN